MNLKINHRKGVSNVKFFNSFSLNLKYDSIASSFGFSFYFDPTNHEHAELACVSHFHEAIVEHNGETLVTGFILSQSFKSGPVKELSKMGGYSKPGVLEDCEIPTSLYPLQDDGLSLKQIVQKYIAPFRLKLVVDDIANKDSSTAVTIKDKTDKEIKKTTAKESQNIKSYITELATQRKVVLSHNEKGDILLTEAQTDKKPLFHVEDGLIGTTIELSFNGQGIHSHITVIKEADADGGNAGEFTIRNPYCPVAYVYRPKVIILSSGDDNTIEDAAKNALAAELKNIVLKITTDRWEIDGKIIRPNNIITVKSPECFLYNTSKWFIQEIAFTGDQKSTTAVLNCVLPEVYNNKTPQNIFVNPHDNLPRF